MREQAPASERKMSLEVVHPNAPESISATPHTAWRFHRTGTAKRCGDSSASRGICTPWPIG
jgi:hypothetical protein